MIRHVGMELPLEPILRNLDSAEEPPSSGADIKVVSYNIQFAKRMSDARFELSTLAPIAGADVLLLQEVDLDGTIAIAHELGYSYVYDPVAVHDKAAHGWFGNAILSRWPLSDPWNRSLPGGNWATGYRRRVVGATLHHPSGDIGVASTHTETVAVNFLTWFRGQIRQWREVADAVETRTAGMDGVIVGGDFNSLGRSYVFPFPSVSRLASIFEARALDRVSPAGSSTVRDHAAHARSRLRARLRAYRARRGHRSGGQRSPAGVGRVASLAAVTCPRVTHRPEPQRD